MKLRKTLVVLMALIMVVGVIAVGCGEKNDATPTPAPAAPANTPEATPEATTEATPEPPVATAVSIGSCIYKFDDTFMTGVRNAMDATATEIGATIDIQDSQNAQPTQNDQVTAFITKGVNALAINPVDRQAAAPIIAQAKAANLPIVFLNREPEAADMQSYDKVWYVGAQAPQSGTQSGQILADYFKAHPEADKNGDGKVQYVLLRGEIGHQDAELRSEYSQKALNDAGLVDGFDATDIYKINNSLLAADTATWDKVKATELFKTWISSIGLDKIEAVLANNDDMALGAIEALKAEGYNTGDAAKYIPVVGVDATAPALAAMADGSLLGTVLNDADNQGAATVKIAAAAANGEVSDATIAPYKLTEGKYVWIDYVQVTADNYKDFIK